MVPLSTVVVAGHRIKPSSPVGPDLLGVALQKVRSGRGSGNGELLPREEALAVKELDLLFPDRAISPSVRGPVSSSANGVRIDAVRWGGEEFPHPGPQLMSRRSTSHRSPTPAP
jgi:hypothetical protein